MAKIRLRDNTELADFGRPYIVAELNTSHFGSVDLAREMIDKAKEVGCDCVKFQSWSAESLYSKSYYAANPIARRLVTKFALTENSLRELVSHCRSTGIGFASTPYSPREVDFLVGECNVPFVKIASMELNNLPFLDYIARTGVPMVLSTGMGEMDEIRAAVDAIAATGNVKLCILHCVSNYPAEPADIHLENILGLRDAFPDFPIGYSDHSLGAECAAAATAMGACLVEKHFTLDRARLGMDNQMATEPAEMAMLVRACHIVHAARGRRERVVTPAEYEQRSKMRRSIVATRDLPQGTRIVLGDLTAKRPGTGMPPAAMASLVGRTVLRDIEADTLIGESDVSH